ARGLKGVVLAIFAPHSHDAADSLDTALESSERGVRAVKISFVALLVTSVLQLAVIVLSGSIALVADTIHNFSDALTAVPLFVADGYHARTDGFTSLAVVAGAIGVWAGYARADAIAGIVISIAILAVLRVAIVEVFRRLMDGVDPKLVDQLEHEASHVPGVNS